MLRNEHFLMAEAPILRNDTRLHRGINRKTRLFFQSIMHHASGYAIIVKDIRCRFIFDI